MLVRLIAAASLLVVFGVLPCLGAEAVTLYGAAEPSPPLAYPLVTPFGERIPGNAAVYYGKVKAEENRFFGDRGLMQKIEGWSEAPLDALRAPDVNVPLRNDFFALAARCRDCDWQLPLGRVSYFEMLVPEIQEARTLGRILYAKTRINIARGEWDAAADHARMALALARHVAAGECLVSGLVGIAITSLTGQQLETLVQQPDSPNLGASLAMLPRPLVDFREGIEAEVAAWELSYPELRDPAGRAASDERWQAILLGCAKVVRSEILNAPPEETPEAIAARWVADAPRAVRRLAGRGWSVEELTSRPVEQVLLMDMIDVHREFAQQAAVSFFLPYPEAEREITAIQAALDAFAAEEATAAALAQVTLRPPIYSRRALVRLERQYAVLQVLEGLRRHIAVHGELPQRLADIAGRPVPRDPVTEQSFVYEVTDGVARLTSPAISDANGYGVLEYEIAVGREE